MRHARDIVTVEKQTLTHARASAVRQQRIKSRWYWNLTRVPRQPLNLIDPAMVDVPSSPREARVAALLVMAETVVAKTDEEKCIVNWKARSEVIEAIALLASVSRTGQRE